MRILRLTKKIFKKISLNNDNDKNSQKNVYKKSTFQPQWMEIDLLKPWLREVPRNKSSFFCTFCNKSMIGDLSHIYRHAESKLHINMSKKNTTETKNIDIDMIDDSLLPFDEHKKAAEIQYAALIAEKNIPYQTAKEMLSFFQHVGQDPNVLKK